MDLKVGVGLIGAWAMWLAIWAIYKKKCTEIQYFTQGIMVGIFIIGIILNIYFDWD